ncbi:ankyrin [Pluteus cervinus]|uniref:Ankyrin n=1 Tax=Pluteus cervinus TaxID=181527 RepID=A0ACD3AWH3_9AGAR|nr:ankyrin [Pluteus cervinus]
MTDGASANERLLAAARTDNEEVLLELFEEESEEFDINTKDGIGQTALHLAVQNGSMTVLEHILSHDECDVDPQNFLGDTPLHLAIRLKEEEMRRFIVESLLDAGADTKLKNKDGDTSLDLARDDPATQSLIKKAELEAQLQQNIGHGDIARDDEDVDSEGSDDDD